MSRKSAISIDNGILIKNRARPSLARCTFSFCPMSIDRSSPWINLSAGRRLTLGPDGGRRLQYRRSYLVHTTRIYILLFAVSRPAKCTSSRAPRAARQILNDNIKRQARYVRKRLLYNARRVCKTHCRRDACRRYSVSARRRKSLGTLVGIVARSLRRTDRNRRIPAEPPARLLSGVLNFVRQTGFGTLLSPKSTHRHTRWCGRRFSVLFCLYEPNGFVVRRIGNEPTAWFRLIRSSWTRSTRAKALRTVFDLSRSFVFQSE